MASYSPDATTMEDYDVSTWLLRVESGSLDEINASVQLNQYEAPGASVQTDIGGNASVQLNQYEAPGASVQTDIGGKFTEKKKPGKSERAKITDDRYKQRIEKRTTILHQLVPGCSEVKGKVPKLDTIINHVQSLQSQVEEAAKQIEENKQLNAENTGLKEEIRLLHSNGKQLEHPSASLQVPTVEMNELPNLQETVSVNATSLMLEGDLFLPNATICQFNVESQLNSTEAHRDACLQVQAHEIGRERASVLPSNKVIRGTCGADNESDEGEFSSDGAEDEPSAFDGISGEPSAKVLGSNKRKRSVECPRMKLSSSHHISNGDANAANTDILKKLEDDDDESKVGFSDFNGLDGERVKVGKYSVPPSLCPIAKKIMDIHGDVSIGCKMNQYAAEANYIMFCASVKEMSNLRLEQVTENQILKWRDAIKDALRSNFNVEFAMDHLKKIARAYIDLREHIKLENKVLSMFNFMDAAEEFNDKPHNSGKQPIIDYESVNGGDDDFDRRSQLTGNKRQLTAIQVKLLERSFEFENKLETKRKFQLAKEVGLQTHQVADWFIYRSRNKQPMKGQH